MKKRICALSLLCLLLLSLFTAVPAFASAESEIQLLTDLGILKENGHSGLIPKGYTRGDFAVSLSKMDGTPADEATTDKPELIASDIEGNENLAAILEVLQLGYMETDATGAFHPADGLLSQDAICALIRILGYEPVVQKNGGSVTAYYQIATKIGLLRGVKAENDAKLTWEQAARMLANAMSIRLYSNDSVVYDDVCFFDYWNLTKHTGRILANSNLGLLVDKTSFRQVNIDGVIYVTDLMIPDEAVGSEVEFYTYADGQPQEVVSLYVKNSSDTITLAAKDIEQVRNQGRGIEIQYSNEKKLYVDTTGYVLVNGKSQTPTKALFEAFKSGSATFVDSNGDGRYDVVHMALLMQSVLEGFSTVSETMTLRYDGNRIDLAAVDAYEIYVDKKTASLADLAAGMPVGVACDAFTLAADGTLTYDYGKATRIVLYASSRTAVGVLNTMDADSVTVEDMEYKFGEGYKRLLASGLIVAPRVGDGVTAYLDSFGTVTYFEVSAELSAMRYGYLTAASYRSSGLANELRVKILDTNGKLHTFDTGENIVLDGARVKANAVQYAVDDKTVDLSKRQLVRYRAVDNVLRELDTAILRSGFESADSSLTQDLAFDPYATGGSESRIRSGAIDRKYAFASDCIVFVDEAQTDDTNPDVYNFSVTTTDDLPSSAYLAGYDANDVNEIKCLVRYPEYGKTVGEATGSLYYYKPNGWVVEKVAKSIDAEGNDGYEIYMAGDNKKATYFAPENQLKLYVANQDNATGWQQEYIRITRVDASELMSTVKSGDVIRFTTNTAGKITYIEKLFDFESHKDGLVAVPNASGQVYGFVSIDKISGDNIIYHTDDTQSYVFRRRSTVYSVVPVYHVQRGKVTLEEISNLPTAAKGNTVKAFLRYYDYGTVYDHIFYVYD